MAVVDELRGELGGCLQRLLRVTDLVVALVLLPQAAEDQLRLLHGGLRHLDLLEPARQGPVLVEELAVVLVGGGADAAHLSRGEDRLQDVGGVHGTAGYRARADDGVDLVDEEDGLILLFQLLDHLLEALLEIPAELGAGKEGSHVQRVDAVVPQRLRHLPVHDHLGEALGDGGLSHARFSHVDGVVLQPAAEHLDGALEDLLPADQGVDAAGPRFLREVDGVSLRERARPSSPHGSLPSPRRLLLPPPLLSSSAAASASGKTVTPWEM